jgi:hypothetical protein
MKNRIKYSLYILSYLFLIVTTIGFLLKLYTFYVNIKYIYRDNYSGLLELYYIFFSNIIKYFSIPLWGLGISFSILLMVKLLSGEKINKKIEKDINNEINTIEIGKNQENYDYKINMEGEDYKNNEIWVCSECGNYNELYLVNCKKCGKEIN